MRLRSEEGFGLIELLMAMVMLNIGILAIVAAFNSGALALSRASKTSTAAALADSRWSSTARYRSLDRAGRERAHDGRQHLQVRSALGASCPNATTAELTTTCAGGPPNECNPSRSITGPTADHKRYRVDTYIVLSTARPPRPRRPTAGR